MIKYLIIASASGWVLFHLIIIAGRTLAGV
jgi:hypothetical protein